MTSLVSYIISLLVCLTIFITIPKLPPIGWSKLGSFFTLCWLILATLVLVAHLRNTKLLSLFSQSYKKADKIDELDYNSETKQRNRLRQTSKR